jgi:hypothetical protein
VIRKSKAMLKGTLGLRLVVSLGKLNSGILDLIKH